MLGFLVFFFGKNRELISVISNQNASLSGGMSTHAGHMYSLLQKEEQMIRVHGMSMRQTTA